MQNDQIKLKSAPFFGANQFAIAAAVLMLHDYNQKATKANCRLAFSAQLQRFFLPLLVGLHGSTDLRHESRPFWKVTLPSTLIFSAKDVRTINFTISFYRYLCSKHPHIRTHDFGGQTDWVLIYQVLNDKSASKVLKMFLNFYLVIISKTCC